MAVLFGVVAIMAGVDLVTDGIEGASTVHWLTEGAILLAGLIGVAVMLRELLRESAKSKRLENQAAVLAEQLEARAAEATRWRTEAQSLLSGLGEAIDQQFRRWELTEAEREVALLLLKGLSSKEIAKLRNTTDATTRQQARAVYKKGGLSGRNDLSAFFLEDLLLPPAKTDA